MKKCLSSILALALTFSSGRLLRRIWKRAQRLWQCFW